MPHTPVPADELSARIDRLRCAMSRRYPDWSMLLLDNKIDLYYFTGTMQEGALVITARWEASAPSGRRSPTSRLPSTLPRVL